MFKSSCEKQICSHPRCWYINRINENSLNELNYKIYKEGYTKYPKKLKNTKSAKHDEESEKGFLPTLKIVNISQFAQQTFGNENVRLFKRRGFDHKTPVNTPCSNLNFKSLDSGSVSQAQIVYEHIRKIQNPSSKCQRVDLSLDERFQSEKFTKCLIWEPSPNYQSKNFNDVLPPKASRLKYTNVDLNQFQHEPKQVIVKRKIISSKKNNPRRAPCSKNINKDYFKLSKSTNIEELCRLKPKMLQKVLLEAVDQNLITKKQSQLLIFQINNKTFGCNLSNYQRSNKIENYKNEVRNNKTFEVIDVGSNHLFSCTRARRRNYSNLQENPLQKETPKKAVINTRSFDHVMTDIDHKQSTYQRKEKSTKVVSNLLWGKRTLLKENSSDCNLFSEDPIINKTKPHLQFETKPPLDQNYFHPLNGFVVNHMKKQKVKSARSARLKSDLQNTNLSRSKSFTTISYKSFKNNTSPRTPPSSPQ